MSKYSSMNNYSSIHLSNVQIHIYALLYLYVNSQIRNLFSAVYLTFPW